MCIQFGDVVEELAAWLAALSGGEKLDRYIADLTSLDKCSDGPVFIDVIC